MARMLWRRSRQIDRVDWHSYRRSQSSTVLREAYAEGATCRRDANHHRKGMLCFHNVVGFEQRMATGTLV